jgi:hypothetical protein
LVNASGLNRCPSWLSSTNTRGETDCNDGGGKEQGGADLLRSTPSRCASGLRRQGSFDPPVHHFDDTASTIAPMAATCRQGDMMLAFTPLQLHHDDRDKMPKGRTASITATTDMRRNAATPARRR